jgi:hypothetical protein
MYRGQVSEWSNEDEKLDKHTKMIGCGFQQVVMEFSDSKMYLTDQSGRAV